MSISYKLFSYAHLEAQLTWYHCISLILDLCINELIEFHEVLQRFLILLVQQILLASHEVCIFEVRELVDAVSYCFQRLLVLTCALLSYAHEQLAHFSCGICFAILLLWVAWLISAEVMYQVLYSTYFIELLYRFIILSLVNQTQSSQYGALLVVLNQLIHYLVQACISPLCLQWFLAFLYL